MLKSNQKIEYRN